MDATLHCNDLKCRTLLNNQAVVTTCSHIFCLPCADRLELTAPKDGQRKCPACSTYLLNPDDAVVTSLNPSEDYKTSILSGLSPAIIMECTGRGLQFWAYQMTQEITYQDFLTKSLTEKYKVLGAHLDSVVREANDENNKLLARVDALHAHEHSLQERIQHLEHLYKDKDKNYQKVYSLYTKLKGRQIASGMELAAEHDADQVLQGGTQHPSSQVRQHRADNIGSDDGDRQRRAYVSSQYVPPGVSSQISRAMGSSHTAPIPAPTPSGHRQQLPTPVIGSFNHTITGVNLRDPLQQGTPRYPSYQGYGRSSAYRTNQGLSANAKSGRPAAFPPVSRGGGYGHLGAGQYGP